ncbi:hypothetical protein [Streptomyces sp. NPDC048650]|uniref:hypothetical protein n=1 Tax=unclassified Streptomyces TaxID=2593676 RepID=UPI00371A6D20
MNSTGVAVQINLDHSPGCPLFTERNLLASGRRDELGSPVRLAAMNYVTRWLVGGIWILCNNAVARILVWPKISIDVVSFFLLAGVFAVWRVRAESQRVRDDVRIRYVCGRVG